MPDISKNHEISGLPIYHGPKPSDKIKFSDTLPHDFSPIHMLLNCLFIFCMRPHVGQDRDHQSWRVENPMQNHEFDAKTFSVVWCWYVVYGMVPVCTTRGSHSHIGMYGTILYYLFLSTYYFIHSHYH